LLSEAPEVAFQYTSLTPVIEIDKGIFTLGIIGIDTNE
jgi:hypothetical protein